MTSNPMAALVKASMRSTGTSNIRPIRRTPVIELTGKTLPGVESSPLSDCVSGIFETGAVASRYELNLQVQRSLEGAFGQSQTDRSDMACAHADLNSSLEVPGLNGEEFTSENVAARISDFALRAFGTGIGNGTTEDTSASRQAYTDYVSPVIEKGFAAAEEVLGETSGEIAQGVASTRAMVGEALGLFVDGSTAAEE